MLTHHLESCNKFITLNPTERSEFAEHYDRVRDYVIDAMRCEDELFDNIFHETQLSGSYADNLKVSNPDEYDVLMILKLPYRVDVQEIEGKPGYVQIKLMDHQWPDPYINRILDGDGYLIQNRVLEWLRSIMKIIFPYTFNSVGIGHNEYLITHSLSGPANTLKIECVNVSNKNKNKFSIDFVGALKFSVQEFWKADLPREQFLANNWNAIPKPGKSTRKPFHRRRYPQRRTTDGNRPMRNPNRNRDWICSYAAIERELIHGFNSIKPLIRIFKKIRDTHKMTNFKSYYIKQIFIHQCMLKSIDYWEQSLGDLMMEMLDLIIKYLEDGELPFYWHRNFDLFHNFNSKQLNDMRLKFERIRRNIVRRGPEYIYKVILTEPEQRQLLEFY